MVLTSSGLLALTAAITWYPIGSEPSAHLKPLAPSTLGTITHITHADAPQAKNLRSQTGEQARLPGRLNTQTRGSQINVRSQPTVNSFIRGYGVDGNNVDILAVRPGLDDDYLWYEVAFPGNILQGWVREDLIVEVQSESEPPLVDASVNRSAISAPVAERSAITVLDNSLEREDMVGSPLEPEPESLEFPLNGSYTPDQLTYFIEIALGSEFGNASQRIRKWNDDIRIQVHGNPTVADREALEDVVEELDSLIGHQSSDGLNVELVDNRDPDQGNVDIYFVPHYEFARYERHYQPGNMGFAYVNWSNDRIYQARILISTEGVTQEERSHLIREELTQSLGLLRDSYRYDDSVFFQGWTSTNSFSDLDQAVIQMLYNSAVVPGMNSAQARYALEQTLTVSEN